ncbi:MAG: CopG family ribbon-helix-helix protein [Candidatus Aenigmarchaeota archaeon]|nr:CopG family ribbon-helix-helix protein [Candidatus Aenigmarchaeota archaeon]MDI6722389.1 CopG family ribbon-helix-helix protein [Candidatus Aenigmarchaeota archaeon]
MVRIISMSLDEKLLEEIDNLEKAMRTGRSEVIREGIRALLDEKKSRESLSGDIECILIAVHGARAEDDITEIKHKYEKIIKIQIHNNLKHNKCLELFVADGPSETVVKFYNELQANRKISYTKLIVA